MSYILFVLKKGHLPSKSATASRVVAIKALVIINDYPNLKSGVWTSRVASKAKNALRQRKTTIPITVILNVVMSLLYRDAWYYWWHRVVFMLCILYVDMNLFNYTISLCDKEMIGPQFLPVIIVSIVGSFPQISNPLYSMLMWWLLWLLFHQSFLTFYSSSLPHIWRWH